MCPPGFKGDGVKSCEGKRLTNLVFLIAQLCLESGDHTLKSDPKNRDLDSRQCALDNLFVQSYRN